MFAFLQPIWANTILSRVSSHIDHLLHKITDQEVLQNSAFYLASGQLPAAHLKIWNFQIAFRYVVAEVPMTNPHGFRYKNRRFQT
jgi:hypothetical protein